MQMIMKQRNVVRNKMLQFSFLLAALSVVLVELVGGLLRDELDEVGDLSAAVVGDGLLCVLRQPEDGGESPDIETWGVIYLFNLFPLSHDANRPCQSGQVFVGKARSLL